MAQEAVKTQSSLSNDDAEENGRDFETNLYWQGGNMDFLVDRIDVWELPIEDDARMLVMEEAKDNYYIETGDIEMNLVRFISWKGFHHPIVIDAGDVLSDARIGYSGFIPTFPDEHNVLKRLKQEQLQNIESGDNKKLERLFKYEQWLHEIYKEVKKNDPTSYYHMLVCKNDRLHYQEISADEAKKMAKNVYEKDDEFKKGKDENEFDYQFCQRMKHGMDNILNDIGTRMTMDPYARVAFLPKRGKKGKKGKKEYMCRMTLIFSITPPQSNDNNDNKNENKESAEQQGYTNVVVAVKISKSNPTIDRVPGLGIALTNDLLETGSFEPNTFLLPQFLVSGAYNKDIFLHNNRWKDKNEHFCKFKENERQNMVDKLIKSFKIQTNLSFTAELNHFFVFI